MKVIFHSELCTACGACAVACMDQNDIDVENSQAPYRRVFVRETDGRRDYVSAACLHCSDAPCAAACPVGCFFRDDGRDLVLYDNAGCIGCRSCADACAHGAISFRRDPGVPGGYRMEKCHGCYVRIENGLLPACVRACPIGALRIEQRPAAF